MLNESTPPDKLMYTMALYGDDDFEAGGVIVLGDPVLRTRGRKVRVGKQNKQRLKLKQTNVLQ